MNKVILIGRLVKDPDIRTGTNNITIARYTLAVERQYRKDNERKADFINCVALGKNGDFAEKYLHKGMKIAVIGSWQTGNYTDTDGKKIYTNDCLVETHEFAESMAEIISLKTPAQFRRQHRQVTHLLNRLTIRIYRFRN